MLTIVHRKGDSKEKSVSSDFDPSKGLFLVQAGNMSEQFMSKDAALLKWSKTKAAIMIEYQVCVSIICVTYTGPGHYVSKRARPV